MARNNDHDKPDWQSGTWDGATREQLRRWSRLTLEEIIAAQEEMAELTDQLAKVSRKGSQGHSEG